MVAQVGVTLTWNSATSIYSRFTMSLKFLTGLLKPPALLICLPRYINNLARLEGFEPPMIDLEDRCLGPLGDRRIWEIWCPSTDSNRHTLRYRFLKPACLPIPPEGHNAFLFSDFISRFQHHVQNQSHLANSTFPKQQKLFPCTTIF